MKPKRKTNRSSADRRRPETDASPAAPSAPLADRGEWKRWWLLALVLTLAVFLAYQPAWRGGFVWDDDVHLLWNPVLQPGGLLNTWIPGTNVNYWPLTSSLYRIGYEIWGLNPLGYHLLNIALHAAAALLVWRLLEELKIPAAFFAAAVFALHPVNVESVAWITQLKNALSLPLGLLSIICFLSFEKNGSRWRYLAALGIFFLSTLSKGMTLSLPAILLALAWWQRGRVSARDLLRAAPFFAVAAAMVLMELKMQHVAAGDDVVRADSLLSRTVIAGCAIWFYAWKFVCPVNLIFCYPRWSISAHDPLAYVPGILLIAIFAAAWWKQKTWGRPVVMTIVCYVALLLPVLGFVNIYFMEYSLVADHWQYAATIVLSAALAASLAAIARRFPQFHPTQRPLRLGLLAVLFALTFQQARMYADYEALFKTTIRRNPWCWMAYNNLGVYYDDHGRRDEAIAQYKKTLEVMPDHAWAHYNLGKDLANRGAIDAAIEHFRSALVIKPKFAEAHDNLGQALARRGDVLAAISHYEDALAINPRLASAHNNLGLALADRGQTEAAISHFGTALEIDPDYAMAHSNLGAVLAGRGESASAIEHLNRAVQLNPNDAPAHANLGVLLQDRGDIAAAIAHFRRTVELQPNNVQARRNLEAATASQKKP